MAVKEKEINNMGKRFLAGIFTVILVMTSIRMPVEVVFAENLQPVAESGQKTVSENDSETGEEPGLGNDFETGEEPGLGNDFETGEEPGLGSGFETGEEPALGNDSETGEESVSGNGSVEENADDEDEEPIEDSRLIAETVSGNAFSTDSVSGNNADGDDWVWFEMDEVYQFGGAPSGEVIDKDAMLFSSTRNVNEEIGEYIYQNAKKRNTTIDMSKYHLSWDNDRDRLSNIIQGVINDHPDLYYLNHMYGIQAINGVIQKVMLTYYKGLDDEAVQRGVRDAMSRIRSDMSDLQKAIVFYDYLTVNCAYDHENYDKLLAGSGTTPPEDHSIYGVFANHVAVCEGYALAYEYLLQLSGIESYMVTVPGVHAWNLIKLGENYYQTDVTWGDPNMNGIGDWFGQSDHTYMFRSDDFFASDHLFEGRDFDTWKVTRGGDVIGSRKKGGTTKGIGAEKDTYRNAFWIDSVSPIVIDGDACYYIYDIHEGIIYDNYDSYLKKTSLSRFEDIGESVLGFEIGSGSPGLYRIGDRLFYNQRSSICSTPIARAGEDVKTEFTAEDSIGGSAYCQGKVQYVLYRDMNTVLTAPIETNYVEPDDDELLVTVVLTEDMVSVSDEHLIYNGKSQEPEITVTTSDTVLTEGQHYTLTYENNRNAGTAAVSVTGIGKCEGTITKNFSISKAPLMIRAKDKVMLKGEAPPAKFEYEISGLQEGDDLVKEPVLICAGMNMDKEGEYPITPKEADAGENYIINYMAGTLRVVEERAVVKVTFNAQGRGQDPEPAIVLSGSLIENAPVPEVSGYRFDGWYQESACVTLWNFEKDIVQEDLTLYAKWLKVSTISGENAVAGGTFALQEIADVVYNGKAQKPAVTVYDGDTLLKAGRDYQTKYYNNINANERGVQKSGDGSGKSWNADLPYVEIIGTGNYQETVKVNFNIQSAVIGEGTSQPAAGCTLKVNDQLVTASRDQKPFSSIKYGRGMIQNTDFTLRLAKVQEDGRTTPLSGDVIPAGSEGKFLLTITGIGNYQGSIERPIYVADKDHLLKNAKIKLGKNLKNVDYSKEWVDFRASEVDADEVFTVKIGREVLRPEMDYEVSYRNNDRVGKAWLVITGKGDYAGEKAAAFQIRGKPFNTKTVTVNNLKPSMSYTGKALTQNQVTLSYEGQALTYRTDYTVTYAKNIEKGTATMTFKGMEQAGYNGSIKKTFRINALSISDAEPTTATKNLIVPYNKAGTKPDDRIVLYDKATKRELVMGRDYTIQYKNNKAVAGSGSRKPPTAVIKGKGNYTGSMEIPFTIRSGRLNGESISVKAAPVAYQENRQDSFLYKPAVKVFDGKSALTAGKDFAIEYKKNTQADYKAYLVAYEEAVRNGTAGSENKTLQKLMPRAVITQGSAGTYSMAGKLVVPLPIYQNKFTKSNLTVVVNDGKDVFYTGQQVKPKVAVSYQPGEGKPAVLLTEGTDYTISYGGNTSSGRNKGTLTISGIAPKYGGDYTVRFEIVKKKITY